MKISTFERAANYVVLALVTLFVLGPMVTILITALGPESARIRREGRTFHWENFANAFEQANLGRYMMTSVMVSVTVLAIATVCSIMAGYAFGTMTFKGNQVLFYLFLLGIMVPTEAIILPLYFDLRDLGWTNTLWGVALPQVAQSIAFGTYWMRTYFRSTNPAVIEAARLDGAGSHRILWSILVPMGRPAITTMLLLTFMWTWNEFLIPLVMSPTGQMRTAPLALSAFQGQYTQGTALLAAAAVMIALPVVIVYIFLQRHFIRGMIEGAVKE